MVAILLAHPLGWLLVILLLAALAAGVWRAYAAAGTAAAWAVGGAGFALLIALLYVTLKYIPRSRWGRGLVLCDPAEAGEDAGPAAIQAAKNPPVGATQEESLRRLIGKDGVARTPLRPSGVGLFDDERVDVVSEGERIDAGARIRIVAVHGNRVVVRRTQV
jgi:membrane-bound ClpP family serine protease